MRVRGLVLAVGLLIAGLIVGRGTSIGSVLAQSNATPTAATPVAGTPTVAGAGVVTLVAWYQQDSGGQFLTVGGLRSNESLVAGPGEPGDRQVTGQVDLDSPDNNELPRITLGDTILDGFPVYADDPEGSTLRWFYFNDDPGLRPATLVVQVSATAGPYKNYVGSATFVSRAPGAGGVLIIVLNPPA